MMKMKMRLGDPLLIFIYSLSLLLLGCVIGIYLHATPATAIGLTFAGASLMVLHDTLTSLIWFSIAVKCAQRGRTEDHS
jgi:hypothetical protein